MDLFIRNLELRQTLSDSGREAIRFLTPAQRTFEPLSYIVREADEPDLCGVLMSGYAYRQKVTDRGTKQILSFLIPGDPIDLQQLFLEVADHSVQMLTRGTVALVQTKEINRLFDSRPDVARAMLIAILAEASIFREWILNVGQRDGQGRIAHLLCEFSARLDAMGFADGEGYELPMTQEDLGNAVGLSSVHVNRSLKALEAAALVERGRGAIRFKDQSALRDLCGFNGRYLHCES